MCPDSDLSVQSARRSPPLHTVEERWALLDDACLLLESDEELPAQLCSLADLLVARFADRCAIEIAMLDHPIEAGGPPHISRSVRALTPEAGEPEPSSLDLPLLIGDRTVGLITLERGGALPFTPDETDVVRRIARQVVLRVDILQLRAQAQQASGLLLRSAEAARLSATLLDAVDEAVIATDLHGLVIYWNRYAEHLYGWRADEVLGRSILEITPSESMRDMAADILELLKRGKSWSGQVMLKRRDGSSFLGYVADSPLYNDANELIGIVGISTDITEQNRIETELRDRTEALEIVNRIGRMLAAELDLQKLVQSVTDASTEFTGAQVGAFFYNVLNDDGATYMLYALSGVPRHAFALFPMPRATELFGPTFRGEGVLRIDDVRKDPRYGRNSPYYGMPEGHLPITSYMAIPVISRSGEVIGGLFFGHPEPAMFTEQMERILVAIAAQTAVAVDNARLFTAAQREIQERRRTEMELQSAMESARAANSAKDHFLATLSHELRTPLTPVLATICMLEEDPGLPAEFLPFIDIIRRNIELEARLIDDLLDLTRIAKGKLQLNLETLDAHLLLHNVLGICSEEIGAKKINLIIDLQAVQHWVDGDSARLQQIFWNLLKNAVKFTPSGGSVMVRSSNDRHGRLRVEVADTGIGIETDLLPRIFNAFEQGEPGITRQFGGLGLGLAIAHRLVQVHGGTITAHSEGRGLGALFMVVFQTSPSAPGSG